MNLSEAIENRRSVRKFTEGAAPDKNKITEIINSAMQAPSACNEQAWSFIVIEDNELKKRIVDNGGSILIQKSPIVILVSFCNETINMEYRDDLQSAAAAIQNMLLTIHSLGLGGCWVCHLPPKPYLRKLLKIPHNYSPVACVLVGSPKEVKQEGVKRKSTSEEITGINKFYVKYPKKSNLLKLSFKFILVKVYYLSPLLLKRFINNFIDKRFVKKFDN